MKTIDYICSLVLIAVSIVSCTEEECQHSDNGMIQVPVSVECQAPETKAEMVTSSPAKVANLTIAAYDSDGLLADKNYYTTSTTRYLTLRKDKTHTILAFANMGDLRESLPETLAEAKAMKHTFSWEEVNSTGFPMTGQLSCSAGATSAKVPLKRLLAKVTLTIDTNWPENTSFTMKRIVVGNTNSNMGMYAYSKAKSSTDLIDGDYTTTLSSPMTFYIPENRQGTLLPDNTDPYLKNRESLVGAGKESQADLCSYMDIILTQEDTYGVSGDRRYRFYIGKDNITNFDVIRNRNYNITLKLTADGMEIKDNWKVDNSEVTDSRSLSFAKDVYLFTPGNTGYIDVNYIQSGIADNDYSHYSTATGWSFADMNSNLAWGDIVTGKGIAVTPLSSKVKVGDEIPLSISTFDGKHSDEAVLRIVPADINAVWKNGFQPSYIAQKGTLQASLPSGVESLSYSVAEGSESIIELSDNDSKSTTVSCLGAGEAKIDITAHSGTSSYKIGEYTFNILAPAISPSANAVTLSADGTGSGFSVRYRNTSGTNMVASSSQGANYFDTALYNRLLKPVISFSDNDAGMFLGSNSTSVFVNRMSYNGKSILDYCGSANSGELTARPTNDRAYQDIGQATASCTIQEPFPNASSGRILGTINNCYDGSMGSVSTSALTMDKVGRVLTLSEQISSISDSYLSVSANIPDMQTSISSGKIMLSRISGSSYSAGTYVIKAAVRNKNNNELSAYTDVGAIESYVMTGLIAKTEESMNDYYVSVVFANRFSISQFTTMENLLKDKKMFGFAVGSCTATNSSNYYVFDTATDDSGDYIDPESNDFYTWGSWCNVYAYNSNTLVGCGSTIYSHHIGLRDLHDWEDNGLTFKEAYNPQVTADVSKIGTLSGVSYQTVGKFRLFYVNSDTSKGKTGLPYHLIGLPVSNTVQLPIPWE